MNPKVIVVVLFANRFGFMTHKVASQFHIRFGDDSEDECGFIVVCAVDDQVASFI